MRYRVAILYQTPSGLPSAASYNVDAESEDAAIEAAQRRLRSDHKRRVGKIDGGDVVPVDNQPRPTVAATRSKTP